MKIAVTIVISNSNNHGNAFKVLLNETTPN